MKKRNLKVLIQNIDIALAELKSEVNADADAYRISSSNTDRHTTCRDINDDDDICD